MLVQSGMPPEVEHAPSLTRWRGPTVAGATLTTKENAANFELRSAEILLRNNVREVTLSMKKYPECVSHLLSKLTALKMRANPPAGVESFEAREMPQSRTMVAAQARVEKRKRTRQESSVGAESATGETMLPSKYIRISGVNGLSAKLMTDVVLEPMAPAALSGANVRKMLKRGNPKDNTEEMGQLSEFGSGLPKDMSLVGEFRSPSKLTRHVRKQAFLRGDRAQSLILEKLSWPRDGVYKIVVLADKKKVTVVQKWTRQKVDFDVDKMPLCGGDPSQLFVANNYSEIKAAVASTLDPALKMAVNVGSYFSNHYCDGREDAYESESGEDGEGGGHASSCAAAKVSARPKEKATMEGFDQAPGSELTFVPPPPGDEAAG